MAEIINTILDKVKGIEGIYNQLVFLTGPAGSGKTSLLRKAAKKLSAPIVNINLELSRLMLDLTGKQRALQASRLFETIIDDADSNIVLLDNIEILFAKDLQLDPLRLLKQSSRNKTLVVSWPGHCQEGYLIYAEQGHNEYRRYKLDYEAVINLNHFQE